MTYKALEDYFHNLEPMNEDNDMYGNDEQPLTSVYFQISTPAVEHYPSNEHTIRLEWKDGARWHDIIWEIAKTLEAHYGYDIKNRVFYQVHELSIEAEDSHGDPDLAKQMFSKELS
jgi:hypothetical protein